MSGEIPSSITNLENLNRLHLNNNQLSGSLPSNIDNLNLAKLHLSFNNLTGSIPVEINNMDNLYELHLNDNQFQGQISENICDLNINWSNSNFNISNNQLCPPYPECLIENIGSQETSMCELLLCGENTDISGNDCFHYGDLTLDGNIDVTDITFMIEEIMGEVELTEFQIEVGDLNGNGYINVTDIVLLIEYILEF